MIPELVKTNHTVTTATETVRMSLDANSLTHLMTVLTDLYSDQALAVIREYSTNALDSHIEAGNPDPIRITLPTVLTPTFVVADQGVGLSLDELREVYALYGKSTKRDSNEVVGMLGLGSKSGLTYALSFTVTTVKNGMKVIASVGKDDDGVGAIRILDTSATDERNGVTITIPVRNSDVSSFREKAMRFYSYWKPGKVLVDGKEVSFGKDIPESKIIWVDDDIAVLHPSLFHTSRIVMGNVAYPVNLPYAPNGKAAYGIVAWVPMGSVNFTPSREQLQYTKTTNETIKEVSKFAYANIAKEVAKRVSGAKTPWERALFSYDWKIAGSGLGEIGARFYWDGHRARKMQWSATQYVIKTDVTLITDYPLNSVSISTKEKLEILGVKGEVVFLSEKADTSVLEGRPKVIAWETVRAVKLPSKGSKGPRAKTIYPSFKDGLAQADIDPNGVIVMLPKSESVVTVSTKFPDAQFVPLTMNQRNRFLRYYPKALNSVEYKQAEADRIVKALTAEDKMKMQEPSMGLKTLMSLAHKLDDPFFRERKALYARPASPEQLAAQRIGYNPRASYGYDRMGDIPKIYAIFGAMPYLSNLTAEGQSDIVLYMNAKYAATQTKKASKP